MKRILPALLIVLLALLSCNPENRASNEVSNSFYPISPVSFAEVDVKDHFWSPRFKTHKEVTIPSTFQKCEETGRVDNFKVAAGLKDGEYIGAFPFDDSDVYKIIEGASYLLSIEPDPVLERYIDSLISFIAAAQEPDGYLHTWRTIDPTKPPTWWSGNENRWTNISGSHELYNMGHLYEAAAAHYIATSKRSLLDVAVKSADFICETFGPGMIEEAPGHQEIELGLVKLYTSTGDKKYLDQAKYFLDLRGDTTRREELFGEYSQDHIAVTQQGEAVGHAVRAGYMYAAMADIAALEGDTSYFSALEDIWNNMTGKKIYLTGGIGAKHDGEAFGDNYELPNLTAYNETCAAIASIYWNHRMFLLSGNSKYIDVLERTLYNGMLAGVSLSGDHYFYPNPLESDGEYPFNRGACTRSEWFDCSCCPSNIARFMPSIPGYIYASRNNQLYVNLFIGSNADITLNDNEVSITQETEYPWNGKVNFSVDPEKEKEFELLIRMPGWSRNEVIKGDLYSFMDEASKNVSITINGNETEYRLVDGYAKLSRVWKKGDRIELDIPLEIRKVAANLNVESNKGQVAIERGPLVYCIEEVDHEFDIFTLESPGTIDQFTVDHNEDLLGGVSILKGSGKVTLENGRSATKNINLIPYYSWSNRGIGKMRVWL